MKPLSTTQIVSLRAHWAEQDADERARGGTRRALKAADVVAVLDELLELRRKQSAVDLLGTDRDDMTDREALDRVIDACRARPSSSASRELVVLQRSGWSLSCEVDDRGFTLRAARPEEEGR
jgi:hypothetical protein